MQLDIKDFHQAKQLLNDHNSHYPLMEAVLQGDLTGSIYVDDYPKMTSALIISRLDWVYVIGDEYNTKFASETIRILSEKKTGKYIWFGVDNAWRDYIKTHISCNIQDCPRFRYQFNGAEFEKNKNSDTALCVNAINVYNYDWLSEKHRTSFDFWDSKENFLNKGFGYFVKDNENVVSLILSASVTDMEAEIEIYTDEAFRGRGYAKQVAIRYIRECLSRGLHPKWDCDSKNEASFRLADRLGFQKIEEYPLIYITLN